MTRPEIMENPPARKREVDEVVQRLREVLDKIRIVLPSLGSDPVGESYDPAVYLVELGRVNAGTARKLATVLEQAVREETDE
ncbi:hypothetical protein [Streptomyces sp. TS71-3]|uniref:hypothetical protein n=1 Tax=Streptomyces sp. TS71-3 TaxID=2733862 RepID=UPI001B0B8DB3|nr:hypothetical protein [Streptomyces sp. TS71-3]GHJ37067.1 hypothetical protein Sm713_26760 [Streptomyces sp. TS71-3]